MKNAYRFLAFIAVLILFSSCKKDAYEQLQYYGKKLVDSEAYEYKVDLKILRNYSSQPSENSGEIYMEENPDDSIRGVNFIMDLKGKFAHLTIIHANKKALYMDTQKEAAWYREIPTFQYNNIPLYLNSPHTIRQLLTSDSLRSSLKNLVDKDTLIEGEPTKLFTFTANQLTVLPHFRHLGDADAYYDMTFKLGFSKNSKDPNFYCSSAKYSNGNEIEKIAFFRDFRWNEKYPEEKLSSAYVPESYTWGNPHLKDKFLAAGEKAPEWSLPMAGGERVTSKQLKGKLSLLEFWFIGCGPCVKAIPDLNRLKKDFKGQPFELYGVNMYEDKESYIQKYIEKKQIEYPILWKGDGLGKAFNVNGAPAYFLVGPEGEIKFAAVGGVKYEKLKRIVEEELEQMKTQSI